MKKTLGGQRLGSGNKMEVDLHGFERSTHDLSYLWRSTMASGTLVPFLKEVALPGDTFDIKLNCDIKTHPTIGPLFGSYKVQLDVFVTPIRLYHSALHNNRLEIGRNMAAIKLPKMVLTGSPINASTKDIDNAHINPSCIFSYLGIRGIGAVGPAAESGLTRAFNAVPWLMYWDIYKNYYANKQEELGYAISSNIAALAVVNSITMNAVAIPQAPTTGDVLWGPYVGSGVVQVNFNPGNAPDLRTVFVKFWDSWNPLRDDGAYCIADIAVDWIWNVGAGWAIAVPNLSLLNGYQGTEANAMSWDYVNFTNNEPRLRSFPLGGIDEMRQRILKETWSDEFVVNTDGNIAPYSWAIGTWQDGAQTRGVSVFSQEGLGIKTYQSDLFNNWLSTEWIDGVGGINEITAVDTSGGSFNIDALNLSKKVYEMLNRIAVSGGTYNDWLEAVYDHEAYNRAESPVYVGGLIKELAFQEVISNTETEGQPLGTLAGRGVMTSKHKGGTIVVRVDEPSYIMGIVSLTPRIDYSQGNKWDVNLETMDDFHKPNLDQIGFQELITEQMAYWTSKINLSLQWDQKSAGKQPAWINYMTNVNEVRGNFAIRDNEMFMTLNRRYEPKDIVAGDMDIKDLTTYIDPTKFNHIFAQTSLDAQNFWTQISIDMTARRKMSAKVMPNL